METPDSAKEIAPVISRLAEVIQEAAIIVAKLVDHPLPDCFIPGAVHGNVAPADRSHSRRRIFPAVGALTRQIGNYRGVNFQKTAVCSRNVKLCESSGRVEGLPV